MQVDLFLRKGSREGSPCVSMWNASRRRKAVEHMAGESRKSKSVEKKNGAMSPMLTISEACRLLNIHTNTMRRWSAKGLITEYRVGPGGHRRFKAEDVAALIMEQPRYRQSRASKLSRH